MRVLGIGYWVLKPPQQIKEDAAPYKGDTADPFANTPNPDYSQYE